MNDRAAALFEQYDFQIAETKKARGAIVAITNIGMAALWEYSGKTEKLLFYKDICDRLEADGFPYSDNLIANKEGGLSVTDYDGKRYIVKRYLEGRECNVSDGQDCRFLVKELAKLHRKLEFGSGQYKDAVTVHDFSKRETELIRVRNFMRKQTRKGEFELSFLKEYPYYQSVAADAAGLLDEACMERLSALIQEKGMICHGDCNQHNILISEGHIIATHFEKCRPDIQVLDLYLFLRKILEKNEWSYELGIHVLDAYQEVKSLNPDEKKYLYARLLYPERFWKIANAYLNKRKSLPPRRQSEKLEALKKIETERRKFLEKLEKELL